MAQKQTPRPVDPIAAGVEAKDEMNLAEFPLSMLTDKPDSDRAALVYEDTTFDSGSNRLVARKLTITAPVKHGLPRGVDEDVIVALIQLTKLKNNFASRKVRFTRNELIALLNWADNGKNYDRLTAALKRWTVVSLEYDNAWWEKSEQRWTSKVFHILDQCEINDSRSTRSQRGTLTSEIHWNETVFNSFASGNIKDLDYRLYLRLEYTTSKRMLRFLDKRLYRKAEMTFGLNDFAFAHVGLSQSYARNVAKIKEKLRPAILELTEVGFLAAMTEQERYIKVGSEWKVVFRRVTVDAAEPEPAELEPASAASAPGPGLEPADTRVQELVRRGMTPGTARALVENYPAAGIDAKIEVLDWLVGRHDRRVSENPAGYLARSIRDDFAPPRGFKSKAQVDRDRAAAEQASRDLAAQRHQARVAQAAEQRINAAVDEHLAGLSSMARAALEQEAVAGSPLDARLFKAAILRDHVRRLLLPVLEALP